MVLDFLAVDHFDFTRKIVKKISGEKLVKMWGFCQNWIFGQKFDYFRIVWKMYKDREDVKFGLVGTLHCPLWTGQLCTGETWTDSLLTLSFPAVISFTLANFALVLYLHWPILHWPHLHLGQTCIGIPFDLDQFALVNFALRLNLYWYSFCTGLFWLC